MLTRLIEFIILPGKVKGSVIWSGFISGLVCSILSATNLCVQSCNDAHQYKFLGLSLAFFGIALFAAYGILARLYVTKARFGSLFPKLIAVAWGGECILLAIQKYVIGHWCPLCNVIAGTIFLVGVVLLIDWTVDVGKGLLKAEGKRAKLLLSHALQLLLVVGLFSSGLIGAIVGVQGPTHKKRFGTTQSSTRPAIEYIGKQDSAVEIYIVTDWFCPACRKVEKDIESGVPGLLGEAKVAFIDLPIHDESLNYIPYNLSLLSSNKDKYMEGRSVLVALAERNSRPSLAEVQTAMSQKGIHLKTIGINSIDAGIGSFRQVAEALGVDVTPTVVVRNSILKKRMTLIGGKQVTMQNIKDAIKTVNKRT